MMQVSLLPIPGLLFLSHIRSHELFQEFITPIVKVDPPACDGAVCPQQTAWGERQEAVVAPGQT